MLYDFAMFNQVMMIIITNWLIEEDLEDKIIKVRHVPISYNI
jgi:hypothetical protein